jgi:hypothetical protein
VSTGITEKPRISRYIARVTPPPFTGIAVAVDYANIGLDPDISLYERYNAVSTAVRLLATIRREQFVTSINRLLVDSGLCEKFRDIGVDVCKGERGRVAGDEEIVKNLVKLVNMCERGEIPVTEELVFTLAQAVITTLVPQLKTIQVTQAPEEIT